MKLPKTGTKVEVHSIDMTFHNNGWPGHLNHKPIKVRTRGWLVRIRRRYIIVAQNEGNERGNIDYGMLTIIPRGMIRRVKRS